MGAHGSLRSRLLGLDAAQQRFDLLQNRADEQQLQLRSLGETLAGLSGAIATLTACEPSGLQAVSQALAGLEATLGGVDRMQEAISRLEGRVGGVQEASGQALARVEGALAALDRKLDQAQAFREIEQKRRLQWLQDQHVPAQPGRRAPAAQRLAFLVHSLELLNHFGVVWDLLPRGSFNVVLHGVAAEGPRDAFERWGCTVVSSAEVLASGSRYDFLVSNHPVAVDLVGALAERQVRFMYAAGKTGWNFSGWNALYDVILCFGPFHAARFERISDAVVVQMGYPRFDRFFQEAPDRGALAARYGCDPSRPTVVWLPTWKDLSSVGHYDAEISALTDRYNVVVKLHPFMADDEPQRLDALLRLPWTCLITDASDNLPLYQLADVMLFDYGGPPLAGIYTDKDMLLLDVPGAEQDALMQPDSPDLAIREQLARVQPGGNNIARLLADQTTWERQRPARRALRSRYFAPHYGFSAEVAAAALLRLPEIVAQRR